MKPDWIDCPPDCADYKAHGCLWRKGYFKPSSLDAFARDRTLETHVYDSAETTRHFLHGKKRESFVGRWIK